MTQRPPGIWLAATFILIVVIALISLGFWQLQRMAQKQQRLDSITEKQQKETVGLLTALQLNDPRDVDVNFTGNVDNQHLILVDNQVVDSQVGFDVIAPVLTNVGWILVNFGWVAAPNLTRTLPIVEVAAGESHLRGKISEPSLNPFVRDPASVNQTFPALVQQVSIPRIQQMLDRKLQPYVIELTGEDSVFLRRYTPVVMPPEKHLGYAIQWFALAVAAVVVGGLAIVKKESSHE